MKFINECIENGMKFRVFGANIRGIDMHYCSSSDRCPYRSAMIRLKLAESDEMPICMFDTMKKYNL